jgi:hypothetical protein
MHRLGMPMAAKNRPVIVHFTEHWQMDQIMANKLNLKGYEYKGSRISIVQDYSKPTQAVRQANVNFQRAIAAKTGEKVIITKKGDFIIGKGSRFIFKIRRAVRALSCDKVD